MNIQFVFGILPVFLSEKFKHSIGPFQPYETSFMKDLYNGMNCFKARQFYIKLGIVVFTAISILLIYPEPIALFLGVVSLYFLLRVLNEEFKVSYAVELMGRQIYDYDVKQANALEVGSQMLATQLNMEVPKAKKILIESFYHKKYKFLRKN